MTYTIFGITLCVLTHQLTAMENSPRTRLNFPFKERDIVVTLNIPQLRECIEQEKLCEAMEINAKVGAANSPTREFRDLLFKEHKTKTEEGQEKTLTEVDVTSLFTACLRYAQQDPLFKQFITEGSSAKTSPRSHYTSSDPTERTK